MKKLIFSSAFLLFVISSFMVDNCLSQWSRVNNGLGNTTSVLSITTTGSDVYCGVYGFPNSPSGVFRSTNNGNNWTQTTLSSLYVAALISMGNTIFAGTYYPSSGSGGVYISTDNGASWPISGLYRGVVTFAIHDNYLFAGTVNSGVCYTNNNGAVWYQTSLNSNYILSLAVADNNIFAGTGDGSGVFVSTNNGSTWTQTSLNTQNVYSMASIGSTLFAATSGQGICYSTNNGATWLQTPLNNQSVYSLAVIGNNLIAGTDGNGIYFSSDKGSTWSNVNSGINCNPVVHAIQITNSYVYAGTYHYSVWRRLLSELTVIKKTETPSSYSLSQNYPNPFNPVTKIKFEIAKLCSVNFIVYDMLGREVQTLVNETLKPGAYETTFDGSNLNSGTYFYRLTAGNFTETKKMFLIK